MGKEMPKEFYDLLYKSSEQYGLNNYRNSVYWPVWEKALSWIPKQNNERVIDFGCGSGQFAKACIEHGVNYRYGCDFSSEAIGMAKKNAGLSLFHVVDLLDKELIYNLPEYDTIICFEVLEHIERDLDVLRNIQGGKRVIFSVPDFDSASHVRTFESVGAIADRYFSYLEIKQHHTHTIIGGAKIFLCDSIKKN